MKTGRSPTPHEIEQVAKRIWVDAYPSAERWDALQLNAASRVAIIKAAAAALGKLASDKLAEAVPQHQQRRD